MQSSLTLLCPSTIYIVTSLVTSAQIQTGVLCQTGYTKNLSVYMTFNGVAYGIQTDRIIGVPVCKERSAHNSGAPDSAGGLIVRKRCIAARLLN
jgi:hypothetical protein